MGKLLKNMLIGGAVFAAVGVLVGIMMPFTAPLLAGLGLPEAIVTSVASGNFAPVLTQAFSFGMFGAFVPPVQALVNKFCGDDAAKENMLLQQKVDVLEAREQMLGQAISPSRNVQKILSAGPRNVASFQKAEQNRIELPESPTVH